MELAKEIKGHGFRSVEELNGIDQQVIPNPVYRFNSL
jgi:hypothetical protein